MRDSGLSVADPQHRRLAGVLRQHQGEGEPWPERVVLSLSEETLTVEGIGSWPLSDVVTGAVRPGPPLTFVLRTPAGAYLLATAAGEEGDALLAALGDEPS